MQKPPVIELREVQLLLKRETELNQYQQEIGQESLPNLLATHRQTLGIRRMLLFSQQYSLNNNATKLKPDVINTLCQFRLEERKDGSRHYYLPESLFVDMDAKGDDYRALALFLFENPVEFAKCAVEFSAHNPDRIDDLTFSLIPAIYGNIWCNELAAKFEQFIAAVAKLNESIAHSFGRIIFLLPEFIIFMKMLVTTLNKSPMSLTDHDSAISAFTEDFCRKWRNKIELCPAICKRVLKSMKHKKEFIVKSFIEPMFTSPDTYGLLLITERFNNSVKAKLLASFKASVNDFVQSLTEVHYPAALLSSHDILEIAPNIHQIMFFAFSDLEILSGLSAIADSKDYGVKIIPFDAKRWSRDGYFFYVTRASEPKKPKVYKPTKLTSGDDLEMELRSLLIEASVIPMAASAMRNPDIVELLKSQVHLSLESHRLHLQMKIGDFERARNRSQKQWSFEELVNLLKQKFKERQNNRLENLQKITFWVSCQHTFVLQNQRSVGEMLWPATFNIQRAIIDKWISEDPEIMELLKQDFMTIDINQYKELYVKMFTNWKAWAEANGYHFQADFTIFASVVTGASYSTFLKRYPKLEKYDMWKHKSLENEVLEKVMTDITSERWKKYFLEEGVSELAKILNQVINADDGVMKCYYWAVLIGKITTTLNTAGKSDVGNEDIIPCLVTCFVASPPTKLLSSLMHIFATITPVYNLPPGTQTHATVEFTQSLGFIFHLHGAIGAFIQNWSNVYRECTGDEFDFPQGVEEVCGIRKQNEKRAKRK